MKNAILLSGLIFLFACSKDDIKLINSYQVQNNTIELNDALIWLTPDWFKIELYSPDIEMTAGVPTVEPSYTGHGNYLFFSFMIPDTSGEISEGTYTYSKIEYEAFYFSTGALVMELEGIEADGDIHIVKNGTVTIQKSNDNMVIDFSCTLNGDIGLTGNYTGPVNIWDDGIGDWN